MLEVALAVPGDLATRTGGYAYARKLLALSPHAGIALRHVALPAGFPHPSAGDLAAAAQILSAAPGRVLLVDGLAGGAFTDDVFASIDRPVVALVHHPLGHEAGLSPARRDALLASECRALSRAAAVVVTSATTAGTLAAEFGLSPEKVTVAEPGTEPAARAVSSPGAVRLLSVGTVSPRKGYDVLVAALAGLMDLDWRLAIAGALNRDPQAAAGLCDAVAAAGIRDRVSLLGAVSDDAVAALYADADVLVSPSLYEGYGMVLAEGMARGVPVVASTGGAAAETVPDAAGLKVPPADMPALRDALARMIGDPDLRRRCADASWAAGQRLPRWTHTVARMAGVLRRVAS